MTMTSRPRSLRRSALGPLLGTATVAALLLAACGSSEEIAEFTDEEPAPATSDPSDARDESGDESGEQEVGEPVADVLVAEVDDPVEFTECLDAEGADDATVTWLDDEVIAEQEFPGTATEIVEVDGEEVEIPGVPAVVVPERRAQAGCIIEYDAPGNCLPAVEFSSAYIPGYTIPERILPAVQLPDGTVLEEERTAEAGSEEVVREAVRVEEECQKAEDDAQDGELVSGALRSGLTRSGLLQSGSIQSGILRSGVNLDDGSSVPRSSAPLVDVGYLNLQYVSIDYESLPYYVLDGADHTEYSERDETTSYTTEGDVLFDSDEHELRGDAESELRVIADDIAEREGDYVIDVEGHTDDLPSVAYGDNDELSELRAESVMNWLVDNAGIDAGAISAEGLGEAYPRADNDSDEGRQQNRRVVITVKPADGGQSEIDYELEDAEGQ